MKTNPTTLKITVAGIRGQMGESLTPTVALDFAEIFGTINQGGRIVLGTETRLSTPAIKSAVIAGLLATGCHIIDIGIVSTPTTQLMVKHLKADGGIMITASHNPIMWNGLKFISSEGIFFDEAEMQVIFDKYHGLQRLKTKATTVEAITQSGLIHYASIEDMGILDTFPSAPQVHIDSILKHVNVDLIRQAKLNVVVDACNGAAAILDPILFEALGINAIIINSEPNGRFTRGPEPLPENLGALREAVRKHGADIGFAQDPDADRLAIVNELGDPIGEDYTLVLAMQYILKNHPDPKGKIVATNLSTTRAFDDVAKQYGARVVHTKIGEVNVSKALMHPDAIVGGEGNGGVIIPAIGLGRDSFAGIAFILEYLAKEKCRVTDLVKTVPAYKVVKARKDLASPEEIATALNKTRTFYKGATMDETDGVKVIFDDAWLHVRASNTEPIVRYFAEAKTLEAAQKLIDPIF